MNDPDQFLSVQQIHKASLCLEFFVALSPHWCVYYTAVLLAAALRVQIWHIPHASLSASTAALLSFYCDGGDLNEGEAQSRPHRQLLKSELISFAWKKNHKFRCCNGYATSGTLHLLLQGKRVLTWRQFYSSQQSCVCRLSNVEAQQVYVVVYD